MTMSIGSLEKSVRVLARQLASAGLKVEVDVFRTGRGGDQHFGPSYVDMDVSGGEASAHVRFVAGGYAVSGRDRFGGGDAWSVMKSKSLALIREQLAADGWAPPDGSVFG